MGNLENLKKQLRGLKEGALTIPNALSVIRILLIPLFVYFFSVENYKAGVLVIFISGLTDLFDGKIARHFNQISNLGKLLDPAADKLTQITLAITLFIHFNGSEETSIKYFSYLFLLFCLKEVLMLVGSLFLLGMNIVPQASVIYGKVATFVFYLVMGCILCFAPKVGAFSEWFALPNSAIIFLVTISATLTVVAFCAYLPDTIKKIKAKKSQTNEKHEENNNKNNDEKSIEA